MRECVLMNVGHAGVSFGNQCLDLYRREHGLDPDAAVQRPNDDERYSEVMFDHSVDNRYSPRSLFIDLDPVSIDKLKLEWKDVLGERNFATGREDAGCLYAAGYYSRGKELLNSCLDNVRALIEKCDCPQGFLWSHSLGGGTGSGLSSLLLESVADELGSKMIHLQFLVYPSPTVCYSVVEPYNSLLCTNSTLGIADCSFLFDNEALKCLSRINLGVERPSLFVLNQTIAHVISSLTSSLRSPSNLNKSLKDLQINMVPYPRIHYPVVHYAPVAEFHQHLSVEELVNTCRSSNSQLLKYFENDGKTLANCLFLRGDIRQSSLSSIISVDDNFSIVGTRIGFTGLTHKDTNHSYQSFNKSSYMISNHTAVGKSWKKLTSEFELMFAKKAFTHWYAREGMDLEEFNFAKENIKSLKNEYQEITS